MSASRVLLLLTLVAGAGCGAASPTQVQWSVRFATEGGRGILVLRTKDVSVAERVTMTLCGQPRTELLTEADSATAGRRDWRAVFPLTPTVERCLASERKVSVAVEGAPPPAGRPQPLPLDEWSAERLYERVHARELEDLTRATAAAKEQDAAAYLRALEDWMRRHGDSVALEQARKEAARARAELEAERREAEEKARAAAASQRAEEDRQSRVRDALKEADAAVAAADARRARAAIDRAKDSLQSEDEKTEYARVRAGVVRLERLADIRARYAPKLVPRPRKLFAARRAAILDVPDASSGDETLALEEGDVVWALAGVGRNMVGIVREERADLGALLGRGVRLEDVEGWVDAAALTPTDKWQARRLARQEEERALLAGRSEGDRADFKRLVAAGRVVSPRVQLGLLRKGRAAAETRRLAVLLDKAIRAAASANDPRMPAICAGLSEVVRAQRLKDCAAAAARGAADENVAAIARDFGGNAAGFAATFGLPSEDLARTIMALATAQ
jgi:hypothetical protein